ncbi:biotin carboxyl carrier protein of acetyl-CoA carboxylase [Lachnospiraceae bacterium]|nr:biotin carboxyl carrier protein of acetyl-CoA carboxylase [Lachnospiraceae bacterium]
MEIENLIKLIETVSASELTGLKYEENGVKLHLTKKKQVLAAALGDAAAASGMYSVPQVMEKTVESVQENIQTEGKLVESPLVGTFYAAPSEDAAPFVTVGDTVKKGQTLAIIEAMKLMNEIESEYDGKVIEILVENGKPVEYGQPLFRIC